MGRFKDWLLSKKGWSAFAIDCGPVQSASDNKRSHQSSTFKPGSRPAIILETLCEGIALSGWKACLLLGTHNGDRDLRHVRQCLRNKGIAFTTTKATAKNKREYKVTTLLPSQIPAARKLIGAK
jgi:hypothetical protein